MPRNILLTCDLSHSRLTCYLRQLAYNQPTKQMNLPQVVIDTAKKLQADYKLDDCDVAKVLMHDYIHAVLEIGFTSNEDDLIGRIETYLETGYTWDAKAIELTAHLPEFFRALYTR